MRSTIKFLHAADLHLGARTLADYLPPGLSDGLGQGSHAASFSKVVDAAIEAEVDFALFAGDSFHGPADDVMLGRLFAQELVRLGRSGIPVFVITGNHDSDSRLLASNCLPDNVIIFRSTPSVEHLPELGVAIHGVSIPKNSAEADALGWFGPPIVGAFNIGLLHTSLHRIDVRRYAPVLSDRLLTHGFDYWALGHIHERMTYSSHGGAVLHFPANTQALTSKDTGSRGVTIVEVSDRRTINLQFVPTDVLRFVTLDLTLEATDRTLLAALPARLHELAIRNLDMPVVLAPRVPDHLLEILPAVRKIVEAWSNSTGCTFALTNDQSVDCTR